jgi:hypothetical protein
MIIDAGPIWIKCIFAEEINIIRMETLKEKLESFKASENVDDLTKKFKEISESFLYGGYYDINGKYRIYIRTVEFYFHTENGSIYNVKDPIVYHKNDGEIEGEVPYFPLMSLHAHISGIDVTFENEEKKYRASALIRAYEVYDVKNKCFLVRDTKKNKFVKWQVGKQYNEQSTYIYDFMNGFGDSYIKWEDVSRPFNKEITNKERKNVKEKYPWSFTRHEDILI